MALICHCQVVRDRTIVRAVRHGAQSVAEVGVACGAGTMCGGCHTAIEEIITEHGDSRSRDGRRPAALRPEGGLSLTPVRRRPTSSRSPLRGRPR